MSQPFPFEDKSIQSFWHSIQKYQGDLVVNGEEFSLYATEDETDQPAMDQITPLIDTCSDLSYRLDAHARLCVQYTADQVSTCNITLHLLIICIGTLHWLCLLAYGL